MALRSSRAVGRFFLLAACVAGGIHAGFSLYWALGGSWLLGTVGEGAVQLQRTHPWGAAVLLVAVGAVKAAGAALPVLVEEVPGARFRRLIRFGSWVGGGFMILYGSVFTVMSTAVLAGKITFSGAIDRRGMLGHAVLWDPLFVVWGATLVLGLWLTRRPRFVPVGGSAPSSPRGIAAT
jgi:hypothetical protein